MANAGDATFEQLWKRLLVYAPEVPIPLAQEFINTAYSRLLAFHEWSALKKDNAFYVHAPYTTGTTTIAQGDTVVVGAGTVWDSTMVNRQIRFGTNPPIYTIITFTDPTHLVIDRPLEALDGNGAYTIEDDYLLCPSDFLTFTSVRDITNNWRLNLQYTQEHLDIWDPRRTTTGLPRLLAAAPANNAGLRRYELWPRATSTVLYPFRYISKPALLSAAADRPIFPVRGDVLREGALAELALWPGTNTYKNPYYDLNLHNMHEKRYWKGVAELLLEDQQVAQTDVAYDVDYMLPYAPIDARFFQTHGIAF